MAELNKAVNEKNPISRRNFLVCSSAAFAAGAFSVCPTKSLAATLKVDAYSHISPPKYTDVLRKDYPGFYSGIL